MRRFLAAGYLIVSLCAVGCGAFSPAVVEGPPAEPVLTPELAEQALLAAEDFHFEEPTVHLLEWQLDPGVEQGLWAIHRTPEGKRTRVTIEVMDGSRNWLESAEYFSGGVVPMHLRRPISREFVDIVDIDDAPFPNMMDVQFRWTYSNTPEPLERLRPELGGGPYTSRARIQFQEDEWRVVGHIRESRIGLGF